ncbi:uncharacterized protein LOC134454972 [Engraulis encrasicolus]|uniref:uncharacterized protein LOC134454972 n=1 Tax=Engraulis encrasicolus TaxID=184585 RepID=UPI002FD79F8E
MQSWEPPQQPQRPAKSRMITRLPHSEISGTSMGSKMAPSFASLYCCLFEQQHIWDECNPHLQHITNWKRYIDDVFFIWQGTESQLKTFHEYINSRNTHLRFTMEYSKHQMSFLDILVYRHGEHLGTTLYRKPTDKNSILHGLSYHPVPLKKSLPISQFSRIRRLCSKDEDFQKEAQDLEARFGDRQYKPEWITSARRRFNGVPVGWPTLEKQPGA